MEERKSRKQLEAEGYVPVAPLTPGAKATVRTDDWDTENLTPAADDPRIKREHEELKRRGEGKASERVKEAYHEVREANRDSAKHREAMWLDQEELFQYRPGRILHRNKFMKMLRTILPTARCPLYGAVGLLEINYRPVKGKPYVHVTTIQNGYACEWTQMRPDEHGLPATQKFRGWRSALLDMI